MQFRKRSYICTQQTETKRKDMIVLNLKKQCAGSYSNISGNIEIALRNDYLLIGSGTNAWKLWIEQNDKTLVYEIFNTKKEAMIFGANWIINNLNN